MTLSEQGQTLINFLLRTTLGVDIDGLGRLYVMQSRDSKKPWRLVDRTHDLGGTDYRTLFTMTWESTKFLVDNTPVGFLYSDPRTSGKDIDPNTGWEFPRV